MSLSIHQLITLRNLDSIGPVTINAFVAYLKQHACEINGDNDLLVALQEAAAAGAIKGKANTVIQDLEILDMNKASYYADKTIEDCEKHGVKITSIFSSDYPQKLLRTINEKGQLDAPLLLYYRGDLSVASMPSVAIIGTRNPTPQGVAAGKYFGSILAQNGYNIVSGLALGCDTAGHEGALSVPNGKTTAFLAHGLDTIYPPQNAKLAEQIVSQGGLLMSEYPIGSPINRYNLVARDRLQAGLADATLVIQTGIKGGTMHAANATLLAHKPLWCTQFKDVIGPEIEGNAELVRRGAQYVRGQILELANSSIQNSTNPSVVQECEKNTEPMQASIPGLDGFRNIIFDLDLTLVNSKPCEPYRKPQHWQEAYNAIPLCNLYPGMQEVFDFIRANSIKVCIVSTAPASYLRRMINYFHIPCDEVVGYHDVSVRKPNPQCMLVAMQRLGCTPDSVISFGDRSIDITASNAAGIKSVACLWGTEEKQALLASHPNHTINNPREILDLIR
jgi:DNA processing protein